MFEKWRIKEHMEVSGPEGRHLGTVDSIDGDVIKLTRSDSADGQHHYVDVKWVDRIEDNRAYLKPDAPLGSGGAQDARHGDGRMAGARPDPEAPAEDPPLFGTSGHGTGMGGSGVGS